MPTIKRKDLVEIAKNAIENYPTGDAFQEAALLGVAVSADQIALNTWYTSDCGCLVGTLYADEITDDATGWTVANRHGVRELGIQFDNYLRDYLQSTDQDVSNDSAVVTVI